MSTIDIFTDEEKNQLLLKLNNQQQYTTSDKNEKVLLSYFYEQGLIFLIRTHGAYTASLNDAGKAIFEKGGFISLNREHKDDARRDREFKELQMKNLELQNDEIAYRKKIRCLEIVSLLLGGLAAIEGLVLAYMRWF